MTVIAAAIILMLYLVCACIKTCKIPECLSDTAYTVGKDIFAMVMVDICGLLWFPMLEVTEDGWQFLVFLAFTGIVAMAVSPYKDSKMNYYIHYAGTMLSMICIISLWLIKDWMLIPALSVVAVNVLPYITKHWLLVVELMMFVFAFIYSW